MIANERQYRITNAEAKRFEAALGQIDEQNSQLHPRLRQAMRDGMESELSILREQLASYDALRSGLVTIIEAESLAALPDVLIQARIAAGLSQKELAERLGLKEQQIQRYEATQYAGAALRRVQAVADALGLKIREQIELPRSPRAESAERASAVDTSPRQGSTA